MLRRPITSQALLRAMQSAQKCESSAIVTSGRLREKQEIKVVGARSWDVIPNPENYEHFIEKNAVARWFRWFYWKHMNYFQKYDLYFEPAPEVEEAIRRLQLKDPYAYDQRVQRLARASVSALHQEFLPKEEWTQWEEESWYLNPYLAEVEKEKRERLATSELKPGFWLKKSANHHPFEGGPH